MRILTCPATGGACQPSSTARIYWPVPPTIKGSAPRRLISRIRFPASRWNFARLQVSSGWATSTRWCLTSRRWEGEGLAVPISIPLYRVRKSAQTISAPSISAAWTDISVFPTPVGPRIRTSGTRELSSPSALSFRFNSAERIFKMGELWFFQLLPDLDGDHIHPPIQVELGMILQISLGGSQHMLLFAPVYRNFRRAKQISRACFYLDKHQHRLRVQAAGSSGRMPGDQINLAVWGAGVPGDDCIAFSG